MNNGCTKDGKTRHRPYNMVLWVGLLLFLPIVLAPPTIRAASFDTIKDLTGKVTPLVTLKSQDNFSNELLYEVRIKNLSSTAFIAESLILVLDKVTNIGGFDREALKKEPLIDQIEILDQDGSTPEGKSYFYIPTEGKDDLLPLTQSLPVTIRIRNPSYVTGLTPSFRVYGTIRVPKKEKLTRQAAPQARPIPQQKENDQFSALLQLLMRKGIVTKEEWKKANAPAKPSKSLEPIRAPAPSEKPRLPPSPPTQPKTSPIPRQP